MPWRDQDLREDAAPTDNITDDKTIKCAGPLRKALHYPAFREMGEGGANAPVTVCDPAHRLALQ